MENTGVGAWRHLQVGTSKSRLEGAEEREVTSCPLVSSERGPVWGWGHAAPGAQCGWQRCCPQDLTSVALAGGVVAVQLSQQCADTAQDVRLHLCGDKEDVSSLGGTPGTPAPRAPRGNDARVWVHIPQDGYSSRLQTWPSPDGNRSEPSPGPLEPGGQVPPHGLVAHGAIPGSKALLGGHGGTDALQRTALRRLFRIPLPLLNYKIAH